MWTTILQISAIVCVFGGIVFEIKTGADFGYVVLTTAGWLWGISEKIKRVRG